MEELRGAASVSLQSVDRMQTEKQSDLDRRNDRALITPLLLMALVVVLGMLFYAYTGHALAAAI